jgi:hypothetical protein
MNEPPTQILFPERQLTQSTLLSILAAALLLGVLGDLLFNGAGAGINVPLWYGAALAALLATALTNRLDIDRRTLALAGLGFLLSLLVAWRASPLLQALDVAGAFGLLGLAIALPAGTGLRRIGFCALLFAISVAVLAVAGGAVRIIGALRPEPEHYRTWKEEGPALGRALAIAVPLVVAFGGLFIASDAVFEDLVRRAGRFDLGWLWSHLLYAAGLSWVALGLFWASFSLQAPAAPSVEVPDGRRLRTLEIGVILGSLLLLFTAFVLVQLRYLFGGTQHVVDTVGLTYAEYARRGFFELVAAAALLLPVLLVIDWARRRSGAARRTFAVLGLSLILLLFVVMASALQRLRIYQETYGLTELRLYATAVLLWLAAAFALLAVAVARARSAGLAPALLALAFTAIPLLGGVNPDALIASTNLDRAREGKPLDVAHLLSLGPDAVPALIEGLDSIPARDRCLVAQTLEDRWLENGASVNSWNWGRHRARSVVGANEERLRQACTSVDQSPR